MDKNMSEYESLRGEIISFEEQQRNVWIYMYVLFTTLFVLGIELSYNLFLVTYIVLIPFQVVINRYQWSIRKISIYIKLFYEDFSDNLNWETMHTFGDYKKYYKKINNNILGIIRYTGVTQLAFLASVFFDVCLLCNKYSDSIFNLNIMDIVLILLSICLFFLVVLLNKEYYKNHDEDLEDIIQTYKNNLKI